jgi:Contractile injection system tape measure protein
VSSGDRHILRKAFLEVNAGSVDAFRFQNEAVIWARDTLLPELETLFSALPDTEAHVLLDRLEIQVEARDPAQWRQEVLPRLKEELTAVLTRKLREGGLVAGEKREPPEASFFRKLAYYLEHGVLPWNLTAATPGDLVSQAEAWLAREGSEARAPELAVLWRLPSARARFLRALPPPLIASLLVRGFRMPEHLVQSWSRDAARLAPSAPAPLRLPGAPSPASAASLPPRLLEEILLALARSPRLFDHGLEEEIIHAYLVGLMEAADIPVRSLEGIPFESPAFLDSRQRILRQRPTSAPRGHDDIDSAPSIQGMAARREDFRTSSESESETVSRTKGNLDPDASALERIQTEDPTVEGLHIANAGLILLAPFLSLLFERLELSDKAELKDQATAQALLHFLATGEEGPQEFQVPLAKVLTGWPLDKAISLPMSLADEMKIEAGLMLESVIGHWSMLKNTSVDGLRESFLQRPGKLSRTPRGEWLLQVEQRAFDMLLQQLPWSFSIIRLPWMKQVIRTEWVE